MGHHASIVHADEPPRPVAAAEKDVPE